MLPFQSNTFNPFRTSTKMVVRTTTASTSRLILIGTGLMLHDGRGAGIVRRRQPLCYLSIYRLPSCDLSRSDFLRDAPVPCVESGAKPEQKGIKPAHGQSHEKTEVHKPRPIYYLGYSLIKGPEYSGHYSGPIGYVPLAAKAARTSSPLNTPECSSV